MKKKGVLYLVSTPIGNLEDMSFRGVRILKEADLVAAEDSGRTLKLLNYYNISKRIISYHEHNKISRGKELLDLLHEGKNIALVTDAGTPGISDPGEDLVRVAIKENIEVTAIPGCTAGITALVISGLPTAHFHFEGFLPESRKDRIKRLDYIKNLTGTLIIYASPHKLAADLRDLFEYLGDREIFIARELTKIYEAKISARLSTVSAEIGTPRGEYVLIIEGKSEEEINNEKIRSFERMDILEHYTEYINSGIEWKSAMKKVAEDRGISRREVYAEIERNKSAEKTEEDFI